MAKAISWRAIATLATFTLVYAFTGRLDLALTVGFFEVIAKLLLYYLHERGWNLLSRSRGHRSTPAPSPEHADAPDR